MIIHVVQPGDTVYSISEHYNIPVDRLILENGLTNPGNLAVGQTIVIVQPETLYTVKAGDTLESIAKQHDTTTMELLRNNPYLSDREFLYEGETIVISYQTNRTRTITTIGYAFSYIERPILIKTLPFLTFLSIFNYRFTTEGEIIFKADDTELVNLAKTYGVAPLMFVSTLSEDGLVAPEVTNHILDYPSVQDLVIDNALNIMKAKGFCGINIYAENITYENLNSFAEYLRRASEKFHSEGYKILITITPIANIEAPNVSFEKIDYGKLTESVDGIIFSSYDWALSYSYPNSIFPVNVLRELLDYAVKIIPPEKILFGITTLGYDWVLPYVPGVTEAAAISYNRAVEIAAENSLTIQFNIEAQSPYFFYTDSDESLHLVWFKDARSFDTRAGLVEEYDLQGLSIWTIMRFSTQMWFIINTRYYIERFTGINCQSCVFA